MSVLEEKKIVIKLPQIHWKNFLSWRLVVILSALLFSAFFAYWYKAIHPYFWISTAHVETFTVTVNSDAVGKIMELGAQEGDFVKKGQMLFVLDSHSIFGRQAQIRSTIAALTHAIDNEKMRMGNAMEEYLMAASEIELNNRSDEVIKKNLSIMEESQAKAAEASLKLTEAQIELAKIEEQIKNAAIVAPQDGIVLKQSLSIGAMASYGDPIFLVSDPKRMWIEAEVPESKLGAISIGSPVRIQLTAYPNKELSGKISYIGPATVSKAAQLPFTAQMESIPVKISFESSDLPIKPGLSARIGLKIH